MIGTVIDIDGDYAVVRYDATGTESHVALAILGDEERRIVLLHTAGLKHRETGEALGLPLATVLSKYHRALKKMRAYMEGDDAR